MTTTSITLTDGFISIPLTYNPSNQYAFKVKYGGEISPTEPSATWHEGDDTEPKLVSLRDGNRSGFFNLLIENKNGAFPDDDVLNAITTLRRWVDGSSQQAALSEMYGNVPPIFLIIQRKDSSIITYNKVLYGFIDDSDAHYDSVSTINNIAFNVVVYLTLSPYGQAPIPITLNNYIKTPNFEFPSATPTIASNWATVGTPTLSLDTSTKLFGAWSQKIETTASASGIYCTPISRGSSSMACGYVWIHVEVGVVTVMLVSGGVSITQVNIDTTDSYHISDKTMYDANNRRWYRVPMSASSIPNSNIYLLARSQSTVATFYLNGAYLELDTQVVPDAWSSYRSIYGRNDKTTAHPEYVNTFDIWGVPGDSPAALTLGTTTTLNRVVNISAHKDGYLSASQLPQWLEVFSLTSSGVDSNPTDATRTDGQYYRSTVTTSGTITCTGNAPSTYGKSANLLAREFYRKPRNIWIIARTSDVTKVTFNDYNLVGLSNKLNANNTWEMIQVASYGTTSINELSTSLTLELFKVAVETSTTVTVDVDAIIIQYLDQNILFQTNGSQYILDGKTKQGYVAASPYPVIPQPLGKLWHVYPGILNRFTFTHWDSTNKSHTLADTYTLTASVIPQTKHLLGTV